MAAPENSKMTPEEFKRRREKLFPMQKDAARPFGVSPASVCTWESGETPVPKYAVIILELLEKNPGARRVISKTVKGREKK